MSHIFYIPGLVYAGETDGQARDRERVYEAYNHAQDAQDAINALPMAGYREWAHKHDLTSSLPVKLGQSLAEFQTQGMSFLSDLTVKAV